ncbi:hypothetical protein [Streptomyces sp. A5-4]|uniref:hypothetical protein n=1 Tax=Streptomyces sp. A5-4 TaxID=3384771 RepID=UPI003DA85ED7
MRSGPLVLVEPFAHRLGGHHQRTLCTLAATRPGSVVIAPYGVPAEARAELAQAGARVCGPSGPAARVLSGVANAVAVTAAVGRRVFASRRWPTVLRRAPHQVTLLARCLTEAACLRTARRIAPEPAAVVVLSASEALHGAAALLGGQPHLRFVHEAVTTEDTAVRLIGRLARRGERRVLALYPTAVVRDQAAPAFPGLPGVVRAFAVDDGNRITDTERTAARTATGLTADDTAVCLVGGWWPYKDLDTVDAALALLDGPLHVFVAGDPVDAAVLHRWRGLPQVTVHHTPGTASETRLRAVYAACDASLVARRTGVGKESGLVMGAVRHGVPLLVSAHDPQLSARLSRQAWARLFTAEDPAALADALRALTRQPLPRPGADAAAAVGMAPAADQTAFLIHAYAELPAKES